VWRAPGPSPCRHSILPRAREQDPSIPKPDPTMLLALLGGINELVLQHLVDKGASTLSDLAPAVEALMQRVCFPTTAR
jgi:hypothetical protein